MYCITTPPAEIKATKLLGEETSTFEDIPFVEIILSPRAKLAAPCERMTGTTAFLNATSAHCAEMLASVLTLAKGSLGKDASYEPTVTCVTTGTIDPLPSSYSFVSPATNHDLTVLLP